MRSGLEELDRGQMRIVDQGVEIVHRRARNIATFEERERLRSRQRAQNVRDDALHFAGVVPSRGKVGQMRFCGVRSGRPSPSKNAFHCLSV